MIELIYNEEEEFVSETKTLSEPKNRKQIGEPGSFKKIFIEDYAYTYLCHFSENIKNGNGAAILLGNGKRAGGRRHLYIQSVLVLEQVPEKHGKYLISEKLWGDIYQESEKYFPGQEILGWFLTKPGFPVEKDGVIEETQRTYFSGADKVFFMMDPLERESAFFAFDGNRFAKQGGYYIYYEKNELMQEYIIEKNKEKSCEAPKEKPDVAMASFRKILKEKQERSMKRKKRALSYGTQVAILLVVFVGAVTIQNRTIGEPSLEPVLQPVSVTEVVVEELPGEVTEQTVELEPQIEMAAEEVEDLPVTEDIIEEAEQETVYVRYIVQAGDTLAKISRERYGSDEMVSQICALNEITDGDYIQTGEIILLP